MVEGCVGPSELHLKKELTALQKARFLRDPETCSSWRSPLSSKSLAATSTVLSGNGVGGNKKKKGSAESLVLPLRSENKRKKVYLYNWRHHSSKSSDSGIKLDEDSLQVSVAGSPESVSSPQDVESKSDTYLEVPMNIYNIEGSNSETSVKRTVRRLRRRSILEKKATKRLVNQKLVDLPSSSLGIINSDDQSDDTENCTSEDIRQLTHELARKAGYLSHSASPLFSGSGCGNWSNSSKILKTARREESSHSCTPASTSSYYRYGCRKPSTVGSSDGTTSFDGDESDQPALPRTQGCGPCYWSKRTKDRGCGGCYSPSLSDTLRRKGSSILCGSQKLYNKKRSSDFNKQKYPEKSSQGIPLLVNSCDGGRSALDSASDELSTNFGELDLEAQSRLDGRRWSSCKSQEGMELATRGGFDSEMREERSLSQKYRPKSFDEIIGQKIVAQSLSNAISRGRIAPAYLFQGPRGTGKTSSARVFAAALSCLAVEENKPCGFCKECTDIFSGNAADLVEVDATNKNGMDRIRYLLKNISAATTYSRYKIFVIDECHMVSSKMWSTFVKFIDEPLPRVVFIFITINPDNLPRAITSRCQKYTFSKLKDIDIVCRLRKISLEEKLDVEMDALNLVAMNSDGSLRDAETMLDQLSLLGRKITTSLVNDLVGVVSDEKLLDLLEMAMSSDTAETVKRSRDLMDSGVDPMALMSQLAGLIMDIIAGTHRLANSRCSGTALCGRSLTEAELERLQQALKILSDAEKQLRLSSERSTWFTAALLQLGGQNSEVNQSNSSSKQSAKKTNDSATEIVRNSSVGRNSSHPLHMFQETKSTLDSVATNGRSSPNGLSSSYRMQTNEKDCEVFSANFRSTDKTILDSARISECESSEKRTVKCSNPDKLAEIWRRCIERCHSRTLRQLLSDHGRLISINGSEGALIALVAFEDGNIKCRAERFLSSITNSMEMVLRQRVEVRISLNPDIFSEGLGQEQESQANNLAEKLRCLDKERRVQSELLTGSSNTDRVKGSSNLPRGSLDNSERTLQRALEKCDNLRTAGERFLVAGVPMLLSEGNSGEPSTRLDEVSAQTTKAAAIDEQRLESAWLQAAEKYTPGLVSCLKPEKNQVLPQNGLCHNQNKSSVSLDESSNHWEDELNHEIKALKISHNHGCQKDQTGVRTNGYAISPSLLHSNSYKANFDQENLGYESGPGCNGFFCWKTHNSHERKMTKGVRVRSRKSRRLSLFGQCGKSKAESRFKK
ncbi:protein STICHEL-like [Typha angustifolia]|uniref:protein STICHEL-like n=1 Tax=Typha angustifolia TaxID=59011 RepID=UPI003C2E01DD